MATNSPRFSRAVQKNRDVRLEHILRCATRLFNREGYTGTTMEQVAAEAEVVPGAIYHYIEDKNDLAFQCFKRGCETRAELLARADEAGLDGLERVRRYLRSLLRQNQPRMILFNEVHALPARQRGRIEKLIRQNDEHLQAMVAAGIEDGSIVDSEPELTMRALVAAADYTSMWFSAKTGFTHQEVSLSIDDIFTHGLCRRDKASPVFPPDDEHLAKPTVVYEGQDIRRNAILRVAMDSFNRHGFSGTSINSIARELGVTRGGIYHYFDDKQGLLFHCLDRAHQINRVSIDQQPSEDPLLQEIWARRNLFYLHTTHIGPLITYPAISALSDEQVEQLLPELEQIEVRGQRRIDAGIAKGYYRPIDPVLMRQARDSLFSNFPVWFNPDGPYTPVEVADNHSRLLLLGMKPRSF